jgi:hypothetical protein
MKDQEHPSTPAGAAETPLLDRRRGPRRAGEPLEVTVERRGPDRRKRKPGFAGLFGAIFGREPDEPAEN